MIKLIYKLIQKFLKFLGWDMNVQIDGKIKENSKVNNMDQKINNDQTTNDNQTISDPLLVEGSKKYIIDLTIKADFNNLLSFLRELEFQESIILINNINLKSLSQNSNNDEINNPTAKIEAKLNTTFYGKP